MRKHDAADPPRHAVGGDHVQVGLGALTGHVVLREARQIQHSDPLAHRAALRRNHLEDVVVPEPDLLFPAVEREPLRALPAVGLGVHAPLCGELLEQWRDPLAARGGAFLAGKVQGVHVLVVLVGLGLRVLARCMATEPAWVHTGHVDLAVAVHHPLREVLAAAGAGGDADGCATALPEVPQPRGRPEQRIRVRGMRDRAAYDALDAGVAPHRNPLQCPLDVGREPVEVRLEQLVLRVPLRPAPAVAPALGRVRGLVDADEPRLLLLAQVPRRMGIANHHHLLVALQKLLDRLGDEVGMLHVGDRNIGARHPAHLPRVAPGRVHHHLAYDVALIGDDLPFAARALFHVRHPGAARDRRPHVARALCERVAAPGGVHVAVLGGPGAREDALHVHERIDLPDLLRVDDLAVESDELADARDVVEPLHLGRPEREPNAAAPVPAHILPGLLLELRVEPDPVVVDLRHVVVGNEARALARRVPRRARRELALLHDVSSPFSTSRMSVQPSSARW